MNYDSSKDTLEHIKRVSTLLHRICAELLYRADKHDYCKLLPPEKEIFDIFTPKLKDSTYESEEYKNFLKEMKVALDDHYSKSSHHPEHYLEGIDGMDLIDLIEMFCDWKAATERHSDGDINKSILLNKDRFKISKQLVKIFQNTVKRLF